MSTRMIKMLIVAGGAALAFQTAGAWGNKAGKAAATRAVAAANPKPADAPNARATLTAMAYALGMIRPQQLGDGRKPRLDLTNSMEFWASGTPFTDYHVGL